MTTNCTAADAMKCAAALLKSRTDWTGDAIAACDQDHEIELDAINETVTEILALAAEFGDPRRYSDGRRVEQSAEIERGLVTHHVWHPDAAAEQPSSWRSSLPYDPGEPSPGLYEVSLTPVTQEILVRVVRAL
ncbi:hypothetical protein TUM20985_14830 [Mycobacterium antarcticum]|uniref:hypothetical protein n=1 Tax=Mycolicibacterium sp. TUM20985 TaxID=3023370 RepID=UPI0025738088|nr:hypothetical protein [Mycolicibacterium sp. TUM20985]BDX30936.1 hypothetical protein TUM20985_14830 [Mycolicibacterium sp. TUM20985]